MSLTAATVATMQAQTAGPTHRELESLSREDLTAMLYGEAGEDITLAVTGGQTYRGRIDLIVWDGDRPFLLEVAGPVDRRGRIVHVLIAATVTGVSRSGPA